MSDETALETELSAARGAELIEAGAELIDVRRPYEFEPVRLAGARNIEINALAAEAETIPRDRPVLLYCRTGDRSGMAADALRRAGYDSYNLAGGIEAWVAEGRPVDPTDGEVRPPLPAS